jgi:ribosomal protein S18 acetylase RimI-like enzyme
MTRWKTRPPKTPDSHALTLRPARPTDASDAAPLIHAAGPVLFNHMFGPREPDVRLFFEALFQRPRNPFSFENAIIAEQAGKVVGLAICADAASRRRIGRRMLWLAPRLRGPFAMLRRVRHILDVMDSGSDPPPDAYYLSILAVLASHRGQGIGSRLLHEVRRRAETMGCGCIALHTEISNADAQRMYARHGYVEVHRTAAKHPSRTGLSGFVAMHCILK